jgi:hypothetical protein
MNRRQVFYHRNVWHGLARPPYCNFGQTVTLCTYPACLICDVSAALAWRALESCPIRPYITAPNVSYSPFDQRPDQ